MATTNRPPAASAGPTLHHVRPVLVSPCTSTTAARPGSPQVLVTSRTIRVYAAAVLRGVAAADAALVGLVGGASAAPERDMLVRPGVAIGRISIGMTQAEVVRILGTHQLV